MSQVTLTFSIIDYFPQNFNFTDFSFIISSESRNFEQEISFLSQNKISHKFLIPRKEVKYSIKVTKNNSLIGISEISIPSYIFQKREKNYEKSCIINMTDSIKRVLFGNTSSDNFIKIEIHCELEYKEKEKNSNNKMNHSTNTNKKNNIKGMKNLKDFRSSGTFSHKNVSENKKNRMNNNIKKHYSNSKATSKTTTNIRSPKIISSKAQIFNNSSFTSKDNKIKENKNKKEKGEKSNDINNKKELKENKEIKEIKEKNEINIDKINNESIIDDELNKEIKEKNEEFYHYINNFKENHPLEKIDSMNDINQLSEYTKNSLLELIEYNMQFYSLLKNSYNRKNKLNNLMLQYNEKFRNTKKEINKIDEIIDIYEIKSEILEKRYNNEKNLLSIKVNELNNFNNIYEEKIKKNLGSNQNKENEENNNQIMEKGKNVLIKVLKNCFDKYGPINKIFTMTNSTEPERINIRKLANKYNLPLTSEIKEEEEVSNKDKNEEKETSIKQEEEKDNNNKDNNIIDINKEQLKNNDININNNNDNITNEVEKEIQKEEPEPNIFEGKIMKWEYVSTERPDKIDKKLELYLKYFYSKRSFPIIIFKKTSTNNYEYGKQKVMIKIEGDTIRVRYLGGYIILDKFIELNAANEEKKLKKNNEKNNSASSTNRKKENNQKKKTK